MTNRDTGTPSDINTRPDAETRLGIDVGGVIIQPADEDDDTSFFGDNYLRTPPVPGAFEAIAELRRTFDDRMYIVSKCGERTRRRTVEWLNHHDFHRRTGIVSERVHFCFTRPDKAPIAVKLGLTHFVDDRLEVLGYLDTVTHRYLFHPDEREIAKHARHLPHVRRVETWPDLVTALTHDR